MLSVYFVDPTLLIWASLLEAALYFYAADSMVAYMMEDYRITLVELFTAGATFTLLAWGFVYTYVVCHTWFPGSFTGMINPGNREPSSN